MIILKVLVKLLIFKIIYDRNFKCHDANILNNNYNFHRESTIITGTKCDIINMIYFLSNINVLIIMRIIKIFNERMKTHNLK